MKLNSNPRQPIKFPFEKVHLENPSLGKNCYVGSTTAPIDWEPREPLPARPSRPVLALLFLTALLSFAQQSPALAAEFEKKPAWRLTMAPLPTHFTSGEKARLLVAATNVGAGDAKESKTPPESGSVKLEVTLPPGVAAEKEATGETVSDPESAAFDCTVTEPLVTPSKVNCETVGPLHAGRWAQVVIGVNVSGPKASLAAQASVSGGGAGEEVKSSVPIEITSTKPEFDFLPGTNGLDALLSNPDGTATDQAGTHPDQFSLNVGLPVEVPGALLTSAGGHLHEFRLELPRGFIVNPTSTPVLCTEVELGSQDLPGCPPDSQVGVVNVMTQVGGPILTTNPLFNMMPPAGTAAAFGFDAVGAGIFVHVTGSVRSDSDYGITATVGDVLAFPNNPVLGTQSQLWGDPTGKVHDQIRGNECGKYGGLCPADEPLTTAAITMPSQCTGPLTITALADSWEEIGTFRKRSVQTHDVGGTPVDVSGCGALDFKPQIKAQPSTNVADSPAAFDFNLHQPQEVELKGSATSTLKDATVTLPPGLLINPAAGGGQGVCTNAQIGLTTGIEASPIHFNRVPAQCPDNAKVGTFEATSPLLAQIDPDTHRVKRDAKEHAIPRPIEGSVYLAEPFKNPFGSLLAIYFAVNDVRSDTVAKFATEVRANPLTGQLTNVLTESPELPLEDVRIRTFPGARASLRTPATCDTYTTTSELTPWSSSQGPKANPSDSFAITSTPAGGPCPSAAGAEPNQPAFKAGTLGQKAGAYSPFVMKLARGDGSQQIAGLEMKLPKGLLAKLAGIPYCSEAQIARARSRSNPNEGQIEKANPSCPQASAIGTIDAAAGSGPSETLVHVPGTLYLAGPYKGAPISFVTIVPAVSGPFDLGTVVVRTAAYVDPEAATARAVTDPLPSILYGIPLDLREANLAIDRDQFTLNPTNCESKTIFATTTSIFGQPAALSAPFGVSGCAELRYKPKLTFKLKGQSKRTGHPALTSTVTFPPGQANTAGAAVTLPRSEFLDQAHIGTVCTRVQFAADQCPAASIYGHARAITPLLDDPVEGPVYLRSSSHELPDVVFDLHGQVDAVVVGRIDSVNGGIRFTFEQTPDVPVSKLVVKAPGKNKGLLINSANLCKLKPSQTRATVKLQAQNGRRLDLDPVVKSDCKAKGKGKKGKGKAKR
jgi:hypothetical protein